MIGKLEILKPRRYWDEAADVGRLEESGIFDLELGFGGDGAAPNRCISDGPFVNLTLHYKEDLSLSDYCISRSINERAFSMAAQENVDACLSERDYVSAWHCFEGRPHGAGHGGVSGTVSPLRPIPYYL